MPVNFQIAVTRTFVDPIVPGGELKWIRALRTEPELIERKSLYEAAGLFAGGKPDRPNLHGLAERTFMAAPATRVHQQIPEPPGSLPIRQAEAKEPNLVPAPGQQRRVDRVQTLHNCSLELWTSHPSASR